MLLVTCAVQRVNIVYTSNVKDAGCCPVNMWLWLYVCTARAELEKSAFLCADQDRGYLSDIYNLATQ